MKEPWEHEKTEADMEKFFFDDSRIEKKACKTLAQVKSSTTNEKVSKVLQLFSANLLNFHKALFMRDLMIAYRIIVPKVS